MSVSSTPRAIPAEILKLLAPSGVLRAGINLSNFLLVSSRTPDGGPAGVSPDLARAFAERCGVAIRYVPYASPKLLADATERDEWDIGLIGAEPQRAETISFTPPYCEIEATYLVPGDSPFMSAADVDRPGVRIAVTGGTAYGLWLERNIRHAELVQTSNFDDATAAFVDGRLEALAGLRQRLIVDRAAVAGSRMLDGRFMTVQQAIGTPRAKDAAIPELVRFLNEARSSGLIAGLIQKHGVTGLSVV